MATVLRDEHVEINRAKLDEYIEQIEAGYPHLDGIILANAALHDEDVERLMTAFNNNPEVASKIEHLDLSNNYIKRVDLRALSNLTSLLLAGNDLTDINFNMMTSLKKLYIGSNKLNFVDLSKFTALEWLGLESNSFTFIDLTKLTALQFLYLKGNQLTQASVFAMQAFIEANPNTKVYLEPDDIQQKVLTSEILQKHFQAVFSSAKSRLQNHHLMHSVLNSIKSGIVPDDLVQIVIDFLDQENLVASQSKWLKTMFPEQADIIDNEQEKALRDFYPLLEEILRIPITDPCIAQVLCSYILNVPNAIAAIQTQLQSNQRASILLAQELLLHTHLDSLGLETVYGSEKKTLITNEILKWLHSLCPNGIEINKNLLCKDVFHLLYGHPEFVKEEDSDLKAMWAVLTESSSNSNKQDNDSRYINQAIMMTTAYTNSLQVFENSTPRLTIKPAFISARGKQGLF